MDNIILGAPLVHARGTMGLDIVLDERGRDLLVKLSLIPSTRGPRNAQGAPLSPDGILPPPPEDPPVLPDDGEPRAPALPQSAYLEFAVTNSSRPVW